MNQGNLISLRFKIYFHKSTDNYITVTTSQPVLLSFGFSKFQKKLTKGNVHSYREIEIYDIISLVNFDIIFGNDFRTNWRRDRFTFERFQVQQTTSEFNVHF